MSSAVEIPQQDEVIKTLVSRCKLAPSSNAFVELAAALLARGHAAEALRVADHGLMLVPANVEGRAERAAALLALGRPRVAYVELMRALALQPGHQRAMRLLGRAFIDAGAPGRAAELLARRSADLAPLEHGSPDPADPDREPTTPGDLPSLFSALTEDLGLGTAVVETGTRRVEVTQLMRKRGPPRPPRTERELESIEGPIVDTTQPGAPPSPSGREPRSFGSPLTADDRLEDAGLGFPVHDEPLFQEHLPFAVHPVDRVESKTSTADPTQPDLPGHPGPRATSHAATPADATLPPRNDPGPRKPKHAATPADATLPPGNDPGPRKPKHAATPADATLPPRNDPGPRKPRHTATPADATLPPRNDPGPRKPRHTATPAGSRAYGLPSTRHDAPVPRPPQFEVIRNAHSPRRVVLTAFAALFMLLYLGTLAYLSADELRVWLSELSSLPGELFPQ